jgi:hypothetical protein
LNRTKPSSPRTTVIARLIFIGRRIGIFTPPRTNQMPSKTSVIGP